MNTIWSAPFVHPAYARARVWLVLSSMIVGTCFAQVAATRRACARVTAAHDAPRSAPVYSLP